MIKITSNEPIVLLLDLDQTIQGDVTPQLIEHHLIGHLNENVNISKVSSKKTLRQNKHDVISDMRNGLLRPHFKRFIIKLKKRYKNVEFFIYTASEKEWAKYIVKIIEDTLKIKFQKRIFTRDDCLYDKDRKKFMKSIEHISPDIFKSLTRKYKLKKDSFGKYQFKYIHMIDNNDILKEHEMKHLIRCEDYNKKIVIDYLRSIPKNIIEKHHNVICKRLYDRSSSDVIDFYKIHYNFLANSKEQADKFNRLHYRGDNFWIKAQKIIKKTYKLT